MFFRLGVIIFEINQFWTNGTGRERCKQTVVIVSLYPASATVAEMISDLGEEFITLKINICFRYTNVTLPSGLDATE